MNNNPFTLTFGKEPKTIINNNIEFEEIKNNFLSENPLSSTYLITGVRGAGKTVLLTKLSKYFSSLDDFIVVELNPEIEMFEYLASSIYEQAHMKFKFLKKEFSFTFHGISFSISGDKPVSNVLTLLEQMLEILKKQNKKVLICIDDVSNNKNVKAFTQQYQILLRKDYSIFLLMTGLFENVRNLQNEKSLTFLYRSLQLSISPLSLFDIADSFKNILEVDSSVAVELAKLTKGYAFAYQVLGYIMFESKAKQINEEIINKFDRYLISYVYEKIYSDLADSEKKFIKALAKSKDNSINEVMNKLHMNKENISQYRIKLINKGIIEKIGWGKLDFSLPRFKEYVLKLDEFDY